MLVNPESGDLVPRAEAVLKACGDEHPGSVDHEVVASVVESSTPVCSTAHELEASLAMHRMRLAEAAIKVECLLASAGTHPFASGDQPVTDGDRYRQLALDYPWVLQEAATYGLHVHVGVPGTDRAIQVCNALHRYLPHMLALSVNSPLWRGRPTGLKSTRALLAGLYPRTGIPPVFGSFEEYERLIDLLKLGNTVRDFTHTWWFIRPHPRYGTIELRICDAQTDVRRSAALAAMTQGLVAWTSDQLDAGEDLRDPRPICEENLWSAAKDGCDAVFVDSTAGNAMRASAAINELLETLTPYLIEFKSIRYLPMLRTMITSSGAAQQLEVHRDRSTRDVVHRLAEATAPQ
ncbi:MAG: Enzymatic protein of unknown function [Thermoleophilia bacterium]|nr:Enzymatic protein of unknown function [Thermoleophilia bacterium]